MHGYIILVTLRNVPNGVCLAGFGRTILRYFCAFGENEKAVALGNLIIE